MVFSSTDVGFDKYDNISGYTHFRDICIFIAKGNDEDVG